jgi:hypothetical protein
MAEAIILEFTTDKAGEIYDTVNGILGVDGSGSGKGDWPKGIVSHTAGVQGDKFVVFEVWESQAAQEEFMNSRLGPALGQASAPDPTRVEWFSVIGQGPS